MNSLVTGVLVISVKVTFSSSQNPCVLDDRPSQGQERHRARPASPRGVGVEGRVTLSQAFSFTLLSYPAGGGHRDGPVA